MTGGTIENHEGGQWLRPTIIVNVDHGMQIMREETFGPVLPVMRVGSVDEAVSLANDTSYGLSAAVFGAEHDAEAVAARVDAGGIFINDIDLVGEVGLDAEKTLSNARVLVAPAMVPMAFCVSCARRPSCIVTINLTRLAAWQVSMHDT